MVVRNKRLHFPNKWLLPAGFIVLLLSLGEYRLLERLLFASEYHTNFVLLNIEGVLSGHPAGRVFQNRLLGPFLVSAIAGLANSSLLWALKLYTLLMCTGANLLLGGLLYSRLHNKTAVDSEKRALQTALTAVILFILLRLLFLYLLEYPWDYIDSLLFMLFGYWVVVRRPKWLLPIIFVVGLFNRESCLFMVLWFVLEAIWGVPAKPAAAEARNIQNGVDGKKLLAAGLVGLTAVLFIYLIRDLLFISATTVDGVDLEAGQLGNSWQLVHNLRQFFLIN